MGLNIKERLALVYNPALLFELCVGAPADPWQAELLGKIAAAANDLTFKPRRFHIGCSRGAGKSRTVGVAATWLGAYSALRAKPVIIVSASERQAQNLLGSIRLNLQSLDDPALLVVGENSGEIKLANGTHFIALPGGSGGDTLRSYQAVGAVIADEAAYVDSETFAACTPMTTISRGLIVLLSSANGRDNVFGRLEAERDPAWSYTKVLCTECPRLDADTLEAEKRSLGRWRFRREYLVDYDAGQEDSFFDSEAIARAFKPSNEIPPFRGGMSI
jgi:helicase-like protein